MNTPKKSLIVVTEDGSGFELNGHTYKFCIEMSLDRFLELNYIQAEVAFGVDLKSLYQHMTKQIELMNKQKFMEAAKISLDFIDNINKYILSKPKSNTLMKMATFFMVRDDEDLTKYDEKLAEEKIKAWVEGGLEYSSFFLFLSKAMKEFTDSYAGISQIISEIQQKEESKITSLLTNQT